MVYLVRTFKEVRFVAADVYDFEDGGSIEDRLKMSRDVIAAFIRKNRIVSADIFFCLPRPMTSLRFIEFPQSVKSDLKSALQYEIEKYVPFSRDSICYDFQVVRDDKQADKLTILLVVIQKASLKPFLDFIDELEFEISGIGITSTAITNYFRAREDIADENPLAIVWPGHDYIEFDLLQNGKLCYSKSVTTPENRDAFYVLVTEELKALQKKGLDQDSKFIDALVCPSLLDPDMRARFEESPDSGIRAPDFSSGELSSSMVAAYGAALKGCGKVAMDINILPETVRKKPSKGSYYMMLILACLLGLLILIWAGSEVVHQRLYLKRLNSEIDQLGLAVTNYNKFQEKYKGLDLRLSFLNAIRGDESMALELLKELTVRIPETAWVNKFSFSGNDLVIAGKAESASKLITILEASPLFSEVNFLSSITKNRDGKEQFRIGLKLDSQAR
jgi:general secretion pathway protein L